GAGDDGPPRHGRQPADRGAHGHRRHRAGPEARGGPQLRHPQAAPRVRQRHEQAARGHLRAAARGAARPRRVREREGHDRGVHRLRGPALPQPAARGRGAGHRGAVRGPGRGGAGAGRRGPRAVPRQGPRRGDRRARPGDGAGQRRPRGRAGRAADARARAFHRPAGRRPALEGAPAHHGRAPPGHRPARLRAAQPAAGVRLRGLQPLRGDEGEHPPQRRQAPLPRAGPDGRGARPRAPAPRGPSRGRRLPGAGAGPDRRRGGRPRAVARPAARLRAHGPDPRRGEGRAQRPLPLRERQEVQALPRPHGRLSPGVAAGSEPYARRLHARQARLRTRACLGLDPRPASHPLTDPERLGAVSPRDPRGLAALRRYLGAALEAASDLIAACKPQAAFFEALGPAGWELLAEVVALARDLGVPVVLDAKRGDIGSTAQAYADAYLGEGPLAADALTVSPYLGLDTLEPFVAAAAAHGRGVYVLVRTSNPGSGDLQDLPLAGGGTVASRLAERLAALSDGLEADDDGYTPLGAVTG